MNRSTHARPYINPYLGGILLGLVLSVVAYYVSFFIITRYRRNIKARFLQKLRKARESRALHKKHSHNGTATVL